MLQEKGQEDSFRPQPSQPQSFKTPAIWQTVQKHSDTTDSETVSTLIDAEGPPHMVNLVQLALATLI